MIPYALGIIENQEAKFLLQLRDDKPNIFFPTHWGLFGGELKKGETFKEGLIREIKEEINLDISNAKIDYLFDYTFDDRIGLTFHVKLNFNEEDLDLNEGQKFEFFTKEEIKNLNEKILPEIKIFRGC